MIPYGRQNISEADIAAVTDVLRSDFLTQGPVVPHFEAAVAARVGAAHAVAANSATSALHLAVAALGLSAGDVLWTSPITFVATANCARYCGATVDFVDIDSSTMNMCPDALEAKLERASAEGNLPKIIVPVHMAGQSPEAARIAKLARAYGVKVVEDASHAIGGTFRGSAVGDCSHSDITVFSFHPVKIITTAEGGMATTQDSGLARRMALLRSHGVTRDPDCMTRKADGPWYYQQVELGWNYRMTELQAALGVSQLERLDDFVDRRRELAARYDALLHSTPLCLPGRLNDAESAWHLYVVQMADNGQQRTVFEHLRASGIGVNIHYIPVHTQPYYEKQGFRVGDFPSSEDYYSRAISIPLYPGLTNEDQDVVVRALREVLV